MTTKRITVAELDARLTQESCLLNDNLTMFGETLDAILGRLDAQAQGLRLVEQKLAPENLEALVKMAARADAPTCNHTHYSNRPDDCTVWCQCYEGGDVKECGHAEVRFLPARVIPQDEIPDDELGFEGVPIEDLMDGGNVAATEALKVEEEFKDVTYEELRSMLVKHFTDTPEEAAQFEELLGDECPTTFDVEEEAEQEFKDAVKSRYVAGHWFHDSGAITDHSPCWHWDDVLDQDYCCICNPHSPAGIKAEDKVHQLDLSDEADDDPKTEDTEQAILRVATRLFYLQMAENIMDSQNGNRMMSGTRSGWVADAQTEEMDMLWPLLWTWVRERGWV